MPKRYDGWMRIRTPDGSNPPPDLITLARKAMGDLMNYSGFVGLGTSKRSFITQDGSVIGVQWDGTTPIATIVPSAEEKKLEVEAYALWVPRGFLLWPAWADAKGGVGLPVIQDGTGPYTHSNLAPGLNRARWTVGGACGEVLISPDLNAGYPSNQFDIVTPLLFHPTRGPVFNWTGKTTFDNRPQSADWKSYRIEFELPRKHYADEDPVSAMVLFEGINTYRTDNGRKALSLLPRGLYKKGEVASSIMVTAGSTADYNVNYPPTYQHAYDRLTKDGVTDNIFNGSYSTWNRGDNIPQVELRSNAGGPAGVLAEWQADPTSNATLLSDMGNNGFNNVGSRGGYWASAIEDHGNWIMAGNGHWTSSDLEMPILSWLTFASMGLAWETFPCIFDTPHYDTAPLVVQRDFTTPNGDCWLNYTRNSSPTADDVEPAMSRHIFCRGRRIAVAPRGGLVWGACSQVVQLNNGPADRLIALIHHPEDQPSDQLQGMTRYLRVWWCDIPRRTNLRLDPQNVISGEDSSDTWGWKGGEQIDLGVMPAPSTGPVATGTPNSLKYASVWRFAPDGTKAVCMRDYGAIADYGAQWAPSGPNVQTISFLNTRTVELSFECTPTAVLTSKSFHDYLPGYFIDRREVDHIPDTDYPLPVGYSPMYDYGTTPISVDYDVNGRLIYAFVGHVMSNQPVIFTYNGVGYGAYVDFIYYGTGGAGTDYVTSLQNRTVGGANMKYVDTNFFPITVSVADVRSASFAVFGQKPWFDYAHPTAADPPCLYFTSSAVFGVEMLQRGRSLRTDWYSNPDGFVPTQVEDCRISGVTSKIMLLVEPPNAIVQTYYGQRFGAEIFSYQYSPVPLATWMLSSVPSSPECLCGLTVDEYVSLASPMTYAQWNPRGGQTRSTIPLPDNGWLIFTKVV